MHAMLKNVTCHRWTLCILQTVKVSYIIKAQLPAVHYLLQRTAGAGLSPKLASPLGGKKVN